MGKGPIAKATAKKNRKVAKIVNHAARSLKASDAAAVKGGLPAVQAAQEAAKRSTYSNN